MMRTAVFYGKTLWTPPHPSRITRPAESVTKRPRARIAQLVEQRIENPRVGGSIPSPGTIYQEILQ